MKRRLADMTIDELIELAKKRELLSEARREGDHYRLEIGAGVFRLKPGEARTLIENMLRQHLSGVE